MRWSYIGLELKKQANYSMRSYAPRSLKRLLHLPQIKPQNIPYVSRHATYGQKPQSSLEECNFTTLEREGINLI